MRMFCWWLMRLHGWGRGAGGAVGSLELVLVSSHPASMAACSRWTLPQKRQGIQIGAPRCRLLPGSRALSLCCTNTSWLSLYRMVMHSILDLWGTLDPNCTVTTAPRVISLAFPRFFRYWRPHRNTFRTRSYPCENTTILRGGFTVHHPRLFHEAFCCRDFWRRILLRKWHIIGFNVPRWFTTSHATVFLLFYSRSINGEMVRKVIVMVKSRFWNEHLHSICEQILWYMCSHAISQVMIMQLTNSQSYLPVAQASCFAEAPTSSFDWLWEIPASSLNSPPPVGACIVPKTSFWFQ